MLFESGGGRLHERSYYQEDSSENEDPMRNLAGHPEAHNWIRQELALAGVAIVKHPALLPNSEVRTNLTGVMGPFTFYRAWRYWVVRGPTPLKMAQEIYAEDRSIRVRGDAESPPPEDWVTCVARDGREIIVVNDEENVRVQKYVRGEHSESEYVNEIIQRIIEDKILVSTHLERTEAAEHIFVDSYHIDTQEGLNLFVSKAKEYRKKIDKLAQDCNPWHFPWR